MAVTGGEIAGVHHEDTPGEILRRHAGILMAGGKVGADVDVDHRVAIRKKPGKHILIVAHIVGSGGAESAPGGHMSIDVCRRDIHAVAIGLIPHICIERDDLHSMGVDIVPIQIAGAVG